MRLLQTLLAGDVSLELTRSSDVMKFLFLVLFVRFANSQLAFCPSPCQCVQYTVRCNNRSLTQIPPIPLETRVLDLRFNKISEVKANAFHNLFQLNALLLSHNEIRALDESVFKGLQELEHLYLFQNQIEKIPAGLFRGLHKLKHLFLYNNAIKEIDGDAFKNLISLRKLYLQNNGLSGMNKSVGLDEIQSLSRIKLSENPLRCDCNLMWLLEMSKKPKMTVSGSCSVPLQVAGQPIESLSSTDICMYPKIVTEPESMLLFGDEKKNVYLRCEAMGNPPPTIIWLHNHNKVVDLMADKKHEYTLMDSNNTLMVEVSEKTQGMYECMAKNTLGEVMSSPAMIKLIEKKATEIKQGVYTGKHAHSKSTGSSKKVNVMTTVIGSPVTIDCKDPSGSRNWMLKNSKTIKKISEGDQRFRIFANGSLQLKNPMPADSGAYLCGTSMMMDVTVHVPPVLLKTPDGILEARAGTTLRLYCNANGIPKPQIRWMNTDLKRNLTVGEKLVIERVAAKHEGNYECIAENSAGYAVKPFIIKVTGGNVDTNDVTNRRTILTERDVIEAVNEAREAVDGAVNKTLHYIRNRSKHQNHGRLLQIARFPLAPESIEASKAVEIYERSLEILKRRAESEGNVLATNFTYEDILSANQLNILNHLTGCLVGSRDHNLLKFTDCSGESCFHKSYRSIEGSCNSLKNPLWGTAQTPFYRLLPPEYEDGLFLPVGWSEDKLYNGFKKPNPREVTLSLLSTAKTTLDSHNSHMLMQWGQFLDHDMDFSMPSVSLSTFDRSSVDCSRICSRLPPCYSIPMVEDDPRHHRKHLNRRLKSNVKCIEFIRSSSFCGSGLTSVATGSLMHREQVNQLSSFIDGSQVYGNSPALNVELRLKLPRDNGLMRTTKIGGKMYLPFNTDNRWPNDCHQDPRFSEFGCFLAGDVRSNEQLGLLSMHTLWVREHNRIATTLSELNSHWDGEKVFQEARKIVGAEMQHITYKHWLPHILGTEGMTMLGAYSGYKENVNPSISNAFATAALRFGHTLINPFLLRLNETYQPPTKFKSHLPLHKAFFAPHLLVREGGIDPLLRGLVQGSAKLLKADEVINAELTEHLFEMAKHVSLDLASINVQRGRDHGLPNYNKWRQFCNLTEAKSFDDLRHEISSKNTRQKLKKLYGHPSNVDLYVGAVLEDPLRGAKVGPTFRCILVDQFRRLRDGDRFWHENKAIFEPEQLIEIKKASLGKVICDNGDDISMVTEDVFVVPQKQEWIKCPMVQGIDLMKWKMPFSDSGIACRDGGKGDKDNALLHVLSKLNQIHG